MSDYDRNIAKSDQPNLAQPGFKGSATNPTYRDQFGNSSTRWIGAAVVAVLVLLALSYMISRPSVGNRPTEQRAAATDKAFGPPPAITARPVPSSSEQPK